MIAKSTRLIDKSLNSYSDVTETRTDLAVPTIYRRTVIKLWKLLFITFMAHFTYVRIFSYTFWIINYYQVLDEPWESSMVGVTASPVTSEFRTSRVETLLIEISAFVTSGVETWMLPESSTEMDSALPWFISIFVERLDDGSPSEDSFIFLLNIVAWLYCETLLYYFWATWCNTLSCEKACSKGQREFLF